MNRYRFGPSPLPGSLAVPLLAPMLAALLVPLLAPVLGGLLVLLPSTVAAQENQELGRMWTFENPPLAYLEKEYGFKPDENWLNSLRMASLRLGGETVTKGFCSASFVSPQGLIMTNNHCVRDAVSATGAQGPQRIKTGYYATSLEKEIRLETDSDGWLSVAQLDRIRDVTEQIDAGIADVDDEVAIKAKREANKKKVLEAAQAKDPKLVPQVVSLFQGSMFKLYQYRVFSDIRLVCLPHLQTAHFGGDPDNFTYPRYSIDFAFVRAYEDGKPADTSKHYFKWKSGGAKDGELVFVPGNPGSTERLKTLAQMEFERDVRQPIMVARFTSQLAILKGISKRMPQIADALRTTVLGFENTQKALTGELGGLRDAKLMAQKKRAEAAFRARVDRDPELKAKYGNLWDELAKLAAERREHEPLAQFQTPGDLGILGAAVDLVRAFDPDEPEKSRKELREGVGEILPRDNIITQAFFLDHARRAYEWLAADDPYLTVVLGGEKNPQRALQRLATGGFPREFDAIRQAAVEKGWSVLAESEDPMLVAARTLARLMRSHEKKGEELGAREETLGGRMGLALFACYGNDVSPDATMTPRFADGRVRGYDYNGTIAPYRTSFYGLYARHTEFDGKHPFDVPDVWLERKDSIDMTKSVNFVSTNDIVGGNSGSVVVNKELEVVGLIFDGNIESLPNNYVFRDDKPRSVSVHVDGIMESLVKIYEATRVVEELTGK